MPHQLDNLRHGAEVLSADGKDLGKLHAVVIDPRDNEVTHIVVNAGPHFPEPGFGAPELIEVPIAQMADAQEEKVRLKCDGEQFRKMPVYVERAYTQPPVSDAGGTGAGPAHLLWNVGMAIAGALASIGSIAVPAETFRKARFERHILNDAPVWRTEPHSHIGDVERVLIDEETEEIQALVVRRGALFSHDVVLPIDYVTEILDGVIHVRISDEEIERLQEFRDRTS